MRRRLSILYSLICVLLLSACQDSVSLNDSQTGNDKQSNVSGTETKKVVLEMEMDENYSNSDPFTNGLLFCVSEDVETLDAEVFYRMDGETGTVEIKDRNAEDILWSYTWDENVNINVFAISLKNLQKGKDYVVRFTGTKINYANVKVTFDSDIVQEKERPSK